MKRAALVLVLLLTTACATPRAARIGSPAALQAAAAQFLEDEQLLVGAGDIANCGRDLANAHATAKLIELLPNALVFTAGDNAYPDGTAANFRDCYEPTWGRFKSRTFPAPGNHEHRTPGAAGYFAYFPHFGPNHSTTRGDWLILSLDSRDGERPTPEQLAFVEQQLRTTDRPCIAAIWHHPLFSSGAHGNNRNMRPLWRLLLQYRADVIINGHDHNYERFAPQDDSGVASADGITQFVVGTGGRNLRSFGFTKANSVKRDNSNYGVLVLRLGAGQWQFAFLGTDGTILDRSDRAIRCK